MRACHQEIAELGKEHFPAGGPISALPDRNRLVLGGPKLVRRQRGATFMAVDELAVPLAAALLIIMGITWEVVQAT